MMNYLYVNYTEINGVHLSKIGISNNPEKRINEFNNGVRYRTSFKNSPVFKRFFTVKISDRILLERTEKAILLIHKPLIVPFYGREVFKIHPEEISLNINLFLGGAYA